MGKATAMQILKVKVHAKLYDLLQLTWKDITDWKGEIQKLHDQVYLPTAGKAFMVDQKIEMKLRKSLTPDEIHCEAIGLANGILP